MKVTDKKVLFQGTGYRILACNDLNVILELQKGKGYKFQGYFTDIQRAIRSIVRRDLLINRQHTLDARTYLEELETMKQTILTDIDSHFSEEPSLDDLFN